MAAKKNAGGDKGDTSKKAAGQSRKAEAAAAKVAAEEAKKAAAEAEEWKKGEKSNSKKEAEAARREELQRKKEEREALLAEEEKSLPGRAGPKNSKTAVKKTNRGLDLSQLDDSGSSGGRLSALSASGIDNALDALSLAGPDAAKIDRHPERRFKAAYAAFEERRLKEMDSDGSGQGLRQNQKKEKIKKEFERHPDNPFNQVTARYDATKDEVKQLREQEKSKIEARLSSKN
ncbi:hypothetical protein B0T19DRAFT_205647 [Cercophora scortea]|uniref:DUF1014-domain-containing protein n=1 Tax=Cercophora scortea TaxID=314031 RepID=A0AAE0IEC9_9PEZI|nr:hypothetical protein B0T19DRAFT_205647 [Cercophora scortea]